MTEQMNEKQQEQNKEVLAAFYAQGRSKEIMCLRTTAPRAASREKCIPYSIHIFDTLTNYTQNTKKYGMMLKVRRCFHAKHFNC